MELFKELRIDNELCFDVGSNIGNKTDKFLSYGAKVVCIEPQKDCVLTLVSKFKNNNNVTIVQSALGSSVGSNIIYISDHNTLSTMSIDFISETKKQRFVKNNWDKEEIVNVTTLDNLIGLYGIPKFCKIDVEGYETEVLNGLSHPIPYISIEFVPELKNKTFQCIDIIDNISNYKYNYIEGENEVFTFNEWVDKKTIKDYLSLNNDYVVSFGDLYAKLI